MCHAAVSSFCSLVGDRAHGGMELCGSGWCGVLVVNVTARHDVRAGCGMCV